MRAVLALGVRLWFSFAASVASVASAASFSSFACVAFFGASLGACSALEGCSRPQESTHDAADHDGAGEADAGAPADADPPDVGPGNPTKLGATTQTSVVDTPWWPESGKGAKRLGYLRHGAVVDAYDRPIVNEDCKDGWYTLSNGGYVCGKAVSAELTGPRLRLAPKQPDLDAGMPYKYGVNLTDGTPLYRRVLPLEERKKYEPWLAPAKPVVDDVATGEGDKLGEKLAEKIEGAEDDSAPSATPAAPAALAAPGTSASASRRGGSPVDAGADADAGRPKLKQLKGRGVLVRKMARGFYLALDRAFNTSGARWWRTSFGFAVPFERIMLQPGVTKHVGTWFTDPAGNPLVAFDAEADAGVDADADVADASFDAAALADAGAGSFGAVGFVTGGFARKIEISADLKKVGWGAELPKRSAVMLTGRAVTVSGVTYHQAAGGFWVRITDLKLARPAAPADLGPGEKWIDVDLTRQSLIAFEGMTPVFATLISSGRRNAEDKERDFPTPTGTFRIREKHVTTTMDGDVASDGPYSIEDVPWVMYFQGSYALHGAFWHDQFGRVRSHGCVNMAPEDARTLFGWADPPLPSGWHGVFSRDEASGTRVVVHEDPVPKRR